MWPFVLCSKQNQNKMFRYKDIMVNKILWHFSDTFYIYILVCLFYFFPHFFQQEWSQTIRRQFETSQDILLVLCFGYQKVKAFNLSSCNYFGLVRYLHRMMWVKLKPLLFNLIATFWVKSCFKENSWDYCQYKNFFFLMSLQNCTGKGSGLVVNWTCIRCNIHAKHF